MSEPSARTTKAVGDRAEGRCEYCRMHQALQGATFHVEHIVPRAHGGTWGLDNLAWCCPSCNLHKSDRVEARDPEGGPMVPLFNPRTQKWSSHFRWDSYRVVGITPIGRATVATLVMNHARRLLIRQAEEQFGLFPPQPTPDG
jgi:hypothetical protein